MCATPASSPTSAATQAAPSTPAIASAAPASMSAIITAAPSAMNLRAIPAPKPEAPPVTSAVLPSSRIAPPVRLAHATPDSYLSRKGSIKSDFNGPTGAPEGRMPEHAWLLSLADSLEKLHVKSAREETKITY